MNTTKKPTADDGYRAARERIDQQRNQLNHFLRVHAEEQYRDRQNWGRVGDLGHVSEVLDELIAFLGGSKETTK